MTAPMPSSHTDNPSPRIPTITAYVSFVPIGIATVLLGPLLPVLSARWSLNYSQAGRLFPVQYVASTIAVALSGLLASRFGFRVPIKIGLLLISLGLALLLIGAKLMAFACIAAYGTGLGLAVPAANLMVADLNPDRRSASLNWLNFCWSIGAVTCPFLVALAARNQRVPLLLIAVSAFSLAVALAFTLIPSHAAQMSLDQSKEISAVSAIRNSSIPFLVLAALFFLYVGTENGFGLWVASYANALGKFAPAISLMTPSFFYASLTLGRCLAPFLLRTVGEVRLVQIGLVLSCVGMAGMIVSNELGALIASACAAGLGLSYVYPITISLLAREFGSASTKVGSPMFVLSNLGGGLFPWIVGVFSTRFGTLKAGLLVPLLGCGAMLALYLTGWTSAKTSTSID